MRYKLMTLVIAGIVGFYGFKVLYHEGIVGQTKKPLRAPVFSVKGCFCHGDSASPRARVWISGPDTVRAGTQALFSVNVAKDTNVAAGFNVAAFLGHLGVRDTAGTQLMRVDPNNPIDSLELTHTDSKSGNGRDTISWQFWYRAPSIIGLTDTIYAVGNSIDTSRDPDGDRWNYAPNFLVRITGPTAVAHESIAQGFALVQNYPNPFNPGTTIKYHLSSDTWQFVSLKVYDIMGREVATLVQERRQVGSHEVSFDASGFASGVYFYRLSATDPTGRVRSSTRRMVLAK
jgi:hypothetical protein